MRWSNTFPIIQKGLAHIELLGENHFFLQNMEYVILNFILCHCFSAEEQINFIDRYTDKNQGYCKYPEDNIIPPCSITPCISGEQKQ